MDVTLALIADAANVERGGKLNVLGVFDTVNSREFPAVQPMMYLVVKFEAGAAEIGQLRKFEAVLSAADGERLAGISAEMTVPRNPLEGRKATWLEILPLPNTPFEHPGDYEIAILVDGDQKASVPLRAVLTAEEKED